MQSIAHKLRKLLGAVGLAGGVCAIALAPSVALASTQATLSISPTTSLQSATTNFTVTINNTGTTAIGHFKLHSPQVSGSPLLTFQSSDSPYWTTLDSYNFYIDPDVNCASFCVPVGQSRSLHLTAQAGSTVNAGHWTATVSDGVTEVATNYPNFSITPPVPTAGTALLTGTALVPIRNASAFGSAIASTAPFLLVALVVGFGFYLIRRLVKSLGKGKAKL